MHTFTHHPDCMCVGVFVLLWQTMVAGTAGSSNIQSISHNRHLALRKKAAVFGVYSNVPRAKLILRIWQSCLFVNFLHVIRRCLPACPLPVSALQSIHHAAGHDLWWLVHTQQQSVENTTPLRQNIDGRRNKSYNRHLAIAARFTVLHNISAPALGTRGRDISVAT